MNKYQKALDNYSENVDYRDYSTKTVDIVNESYDTLQELVDKTKRPILEEVKKEWEELEYSFNIYNDEYHNGNKYKRCVIYKEIFKNTRLIVLHYYDKRISLNYFWETFDAEGYPTCKYMLFDITLQEHQLLNKTLKALGWFDE